MNTPGHAVVSVAAVVAMHRPELAAPVAVAAVLPDLPIAVLYLDARYRRGLPSERIWAEVYQQRFWQDLIHGLHSFPLALLGCAVAAVLGAPAWLAAFVSLLFHALLDFPIHARDAHRHFFPLSHFRFISPLSYWDVRHHARSVLAVEMIAVAAAGAFLWGHSPFWAQLALVAVAIFYVDGYRRLWLPAAVEPAQS